MRHLVPLVLCSVLSICLSGCAGAPKRDAHDAPAVSESERVIPVEIEGIWASEDARIDDSGFLWEGAALYVDARGVGALVGGPPPIGVEARMTFDEAARVLRCTPADPALQAVDLTYDPATKTLEATSEGVTEILHRCADHVSASVWNVLGLDPELR